MQRNKALKFAIILFILLLVVFSVFILFPRKYTLLDGGTHVYESFGFGAIYKIEDRHRICSEDGFSYYEVGKVITVLDHEIYNNAHIDYESKSVSYHSPEVMENQRIIDEYFDSLERNSQTSEE